jgi:hypothetical protein
MISADDLDLIQVTDDPRQVVEIVRKAGRRRDRATGESGIRAP